MTKVAWMILLAGCGEATHRSVSDCETPTESTPALWPGCGTFTGPAPITGDEQPGPAETIGTTCVVPPRLRLSDIPDQPSLDDGDPDVVAIFEVDGHDLVGKFVSDVAAAEQALGLWQEVVARIPENQLLDLVQLEVSTDPDPAAYFNRTGDVTASRMGLKLGFSTELFSRNPADVCAPLEPRRGTFDWSLVHEFGHLRGWVDGSWPRFLETFPDVRGSGEGYPKDGSPVLTGDFVTSYAERADGDEDHAESFTTFVMLDGLPPQTADEPLALQKVRWMASQPGLVALRQALRITEPDGGGVTVEGAPRLPSALEPIAPPAFLHGTWQEDAASGEVARQFVFTAHNVVENEVLDGVVTPVRDLVELRDCGVLQRFDVNLEEANGWGYNATLGRSFDDPLEDSFFVDGDLVYWSRLVPAESDVVLHRVP